MTTATISNRQPAVRFDDLRAGNSIRGGQSDEIRLMQRQLGVKDDGVFGAKTREALRGWQSSHGLGNDGVFGAKTRDAMFTKSGDSWTPSTGSAPVKQPAAPVGAAAPTPGSSVRPDQLTQGQLDRMQRLATANNFTGQGGSSCVVSTRTNLQKNGLGKDLIPTGGAGGADPNNVRAMAVNMMTGGNWQSLAVPGSSPVTLKSASQFGGSATVNQMSYADYDKARRAGQIPNGAVVLQTRHDSWNNRNTYGNDIGVLRKEKGGIYNFRQSGNNIYGNTQKVVVLVPRA